MRVVCAALMAVLTLSGCALRGEGPYTYDRGDRVDRDGNRDVGWCDVHRDDMHCRVAMQSDGRRG
jgi:hypothetical protein